MDGCPLARVLRNDDRRIQHERANNNCAYKVDDTRKLGKNLPTYPCKWQPTTTARAPILQFDKSNMNRRGFYIISFGFFIRPLLAGRKY